MKLHLLLIAVVTLMVFLWSRSDSVTTVYAPHPAPAIGEGSPVSTQMNSAKPFTGLSGVAF